jgi:cytochrome c biogenesis protein CcmG/thiol:disulfide interchange protein DsbE
LPSTSSSAPPDPPADATSAGRRRSSTRWILPAVLVAAIVVGIAAWLTATDGGSPSSSSPPATAPAPASEGLVSTPGVATTGSAAPDFDLPRLRGDGSIDLRDLRGKAVVVNFWASWCIPCQQEFPVLRRVQRRYRDDDLVIIGIAHRDIPSDARAFARDERATWDLVTDERSETAIDYGVRAIPQTFFIRPDGVISQRYFQAPSEATFDAEIDAILPPEAP